ncbi:hypothetical protein [Paenibacillus polymyxa]|uniref:hypothetical protein n=1 Tax=Paenibacillus polymyxa TaxID=1406 RepID=UPI0032AEAEA3
MTIWHSWRAEVYHCRFRLTEIKEYGLTFYEFALLPSILNLPKACHSRDVQQMKEPVSEKEVPQRTVRVAIHMPN